jgi:small subunit ribosomal protein S1
MSNIAINDIGTAEDFLRAIDESMKEYAVGDLVKGLVVQIDRDGALIDIGSKMEAFIPKKEISAKRVFDIYEVLEIGKTVQANIIRVDEEGQFVLSMKEAEVISLWDQVEAIWNSDDKTVSGVITKVVKGGMIVDIGVRAFLPSSQSHINKDADFTTFVGQTVEAKIIQFERHKGNIVISRKALIENDLKQEKMIHYSKLKEGLSYVGTVSGINNFGIFVSLGLVSGLVHKSKMGKWTPEQFTVGHDIEVEVLEIDFDNDRLSLAFKG